MPFGNSGIAIDGNDFYLADPNTGRIYKYTRTALGAIPTDSGINFGTAVQEPEGLAIDYCTFAGKKALWAYHASNDRSSKLAAYEIGTATNSGCPPPVSATTTDVTTTSSTPSSSGTAGGISNELPSQVSVGSGKSGSQLAGTPISFDATGPGDPTGLLFTYYWIFGDAGSKEIRAAGKTKHTYRCAGRYRLRVKITNTIGQTVVLSKTVTVGFSKSATKKFRGLKISPTVAISGKTARFGIKAATIKHYRGHRARVRSVDYTFDRKRIGRGKRARAKAQAKLTTGKTHTLKIVVHFRGTGKVKKITVCFRS